MHSHLPPELWDKVFMDVDADALRSVSLTCREFYTIARPFIFRSLSLCTRNPGQLEDRDSARLEFYASDVIAPFVRSFAVYNTSPDRIPPSIFYRLGRFINLRVLCCIGVNFTRISFQQIATFQSLRSLWLAECEPPPNTDLLPSLHTHTFDYVHLWEPAVNLERLRVDRWIELLDRSRLEALDVPLTQGVCSGILAIDNPRSFPSLQTMILHVDPDQGTLPQVPTILSKTPAVRCLKLHLFHYPTQYLGGFISTTTSLVPCLEVYHGPHELLHVIRGRAAESPSAPLRKLYLKSIAERGDPLTAHMDTLISCRPHLRDLTHLHISMLKSIKLDSLVVLKDMCPLLQEFHIHAHTLTRDDVPLNDVHRLLLPGTLMSVSIQWTSRREAPNIVAAKDSLLNRLPSLRRLWLCDWSQIALVWHRTSLGKEHCTVREVGSETTKSDVWKMRVIAFPEEPRLLQ